MRKIGHGLEARDFLDIEMHDVEVDNMEADDAEE